MDSIAAGRRRAPPAGPHRRRGSARRRRSSAMRRPAPFPRMSTRSAKSFSCSAACSPTSTATIPPAPMSAIRRESRHTPRTTAPGCIILRQIAADEADRRDRGSLSTARQPAWEQADAAGYDASPLHLCARYRRAGDAGTARSGPIMAEVDCPDGEEIFMLSGDLQDRIRDVRCRDHGSEPGGFPAADLGSEDGATYWVKRGHLRPMS